MKACIVSDSHDHKPLLDAAVGAAKEKGAEVVLHCGDIVAPNTLWCLTKHGLPAHVIHGNNTGDLFALANLAAKADNLIRYHGMDAGVEIHGKKIFLVHYPHYAKAMAATGDWDMVCCGHSHKTHIEAIDNIKGGVTHLINPGTIGGIGRAPATYIMADLEEMTFEIHEVSKFLEQGYSELAG